VIADRMVHELKGRVTTKKIEDITLEFVKNKEGEILELDIFDRSTNPIKVRKQADIDGLIKELKKIKIKE